MPSWLLSVDPRCNKMRRVRRWERVPHQSSTTHKMRQRTVPGPERKRKMQNMPRWLLSDGPRCNDMLRVRCWQRMSVTCRAPAEMRCGLVPRFSLSHQMQKVQRQRVFGAHRQLRMPVMPIQLHFREGPKYLQVPSQICRDELIPSHYGNRIFREFSLCQVSSRRQLR